jgi:retron-type reverse transcriptase
MMTAAKLFDRTFRPSELRKIFEKYIVNNSAVGIDNIKPLNFSKVLDTELSSAADRVLNGQYKFSFYKEKLISKGAKKFPRVLSIPTVRDRVVLKALSIILAKTFPCSIIKIPQIKIDNLINQIEQKKFDSFIKIDLQDFTPLYPIA